MKRSPRTVLTAVLPPIVLFAVVVLVWQAVVRIWAVPAFLLPSPTDVVAAARENSAKLAWATGMTAAGAASGFVVSLILGVLIALVFSQSAIIRRSFFPYAILLQTVPIVAIAPLIVLWSGTGFRSVVLVALIVSVFPIITNATAGLTAIDPDLVDLFRLHNASRWQTLFKLRLPSAVPSTVTGAKTSSGLAGHRHDRRRIFCGLRSGRPLRARLPDPGVDDAAPSRRRAVRSGARDAARLAGLRCREPGGSARAPPLQLNGVVRTPGRAAGVSRPVFCLPNGADG